MLVILALTFLFFLLFLIINFFLHFFFIFILRPIQGLELRLIASHTLSLSSVVKPYVDFVEVSLSEFLLIVSADEIFKETNFAALGCWIKP